MAKKSQVKKQQTGAATKKTTVKKTAKVTQAEPVEDELNQDTLKLQESSDEEEEGEGNDEDFGGFSSTDDEKDDEEEEDDDDNEESGDDEEEESEEQQPPQKKKNTTKHEVKKPVKKTTQATTIANIEKYKRGIMYIGRLPKQVEEKDLKRYFKQFGQLLNVRIARNRKTGASKHYGFIEFQNYEVAKIAQDTMNNYLLFGHLLKCELVDSSNESAEKYLGLFKTKNKTFKKIPWAKISKHKFEKSKTDVKWKQLKKQHDDKAKARLDKLKDAGFNFDLVK
ncbi:rRNA-binding ribosome biosynthesis protein [Saccharomycopsis crataegensis]|uniref:rRNA-binding ribosome biosynthesis protein n=1 Tax=Saccharomycopsis crataegensis TaxID=43959 RepID=A0AAV5QFH4_9ASCO|nr:rRNA-binding ribosome biosynthesis protein [Saccharomycopsis crataegensis]